MPDYTTPPTAVAGSNLTAADWNTKIRDSIEALAKRPRCMAHRTASQSIANAAVTMIQWTAEAYDSDNMWTAGGTADRIIVPRAGLYLAVFNAQFAINGTGGRHLAIMKNGVGVAQWNSSGSAAWYIGASVVTVQSMIAGDYFQGMAYQSSGAALNLDIAYPINMTVHEIGLT